MVFLVHKFAQFYTKLENHHHHHHHRHQDEDLSANLKAFRSEVSKLISQLALDLNPRLEILSLSWIEKCLGILPFINKALAKLAVDIDYPMSIWEIDSIEEYLSYTLCLLELFNSISSAFTHLEKGRVSLSHGLTLLENSASLAAKHLKEIQPGCYSTKFGEELSKKSDKARIFNGKERVINEAVKELRSISFWVCGILLSGLYSDVKPYMELKKIAGGFEGSSVLTLDCKISEVLLVKKNPALKEVKEVNDAVAQLLVASDEVKIKVAKEVKTKLNAFVIISDAVKAEVDDLFSKVMSQRTELIDCFRLRKQS